MSYSQLEINKFSPEGNLLRKIRCLAGRVTVFRSQNEAEIEKFKKALEGKAQTERFSILLDGGQFVPSKHVFIGFGALDEAPTGVAISEYLVGNGAHPETIEANLALFGLGGLSQESCLNITAAQWKMLRLACICLRGAHDEVILMHEPFDEIPEAYKDVFAEKLAKRAWEKNALMVVTKLSYRPEVWIENDYIARVQLERPRQGTIGFGGGDLSSAETIANLRKELGIDLKGVPGFQNAPAEKPGVDLLGAPATSISKKLLPLINSPKTLGLTVSLVVVLCAIMFLLIHQVEPNSATTATLPNVTVSNIQNGPSSGTSSDKSPSQPGSSNNTVLANNSSVLDGFSPEIQQAWADAIEHPEVLLRSPQSAPKSEAALVGDGAEGSLIEQLHNELVR